VQEEEHDEHDHSHHDHSRHDHARWVWAVVSCWSL